MELLIVFGVLLTIAFAFYVAWSAQGLMLGFTWLAYFYVFSSTLSAFTHGFISGSDLQWFSDYHEKVAVYAVFGCLGMAIGILRANKNRPKLTLLVDRNLTWLNARMAAFLYSLGLVSGILLFFLRAVPTLSTALEQLTLFKNVALVVFVVDSIKRNHWKTSAIAFLIHLPVAVAGALASGHTPFEVNLLIPVACVVTAAKGFNGRSVAILMSLCSAFFLLFVGWMENRGQIRSGELSNFSFVDGSSRLGEGMVDSILNSDMNSNSVNDRIRERIDMSDILAKQASYQPYYEPYAYGETFLDAGIALIPRVLWPSKPVLAGGSDFVARFSGIVRSTEDTTSVGLPYPFELYANGGPVLVVFGLFAIGWLIAKIELRCIFGHDSLARKLGLLSILITLGAGGQRMNLVIPAVIAGFLSSWCLGYLLERFAPRFSKEIQGLA